MFLGVVETKILDLCPLPPIYPFQMAPSGSRFGPIRPGSKNRGVQKPQKYPIRPKMPKNPNFCYFLSLAKKWHFWGVWKTHGLDTPEPYLNPVKAFLSCASLLWWSVLELVEGSVGDFRVFMVIVKNRPFLDPFYDGVIGCSASFQSQC